MQEIKQLTLPETVEREGELSDYLDGGGEVTAAPLAVGEEDNSRTPSTRKHKPHDNSNLKMKGESVPIMSDINRTREG